jgi:hypothetical protein
MSIEITLHVLQIIGGSMTAKRKHEDVDALNIRSDGENFTMPNYAESESDFFSRELLCCCVW